MFNVFNMGIGMVIACDKDDALDIQTMLIERGEKAYVIGSVVEGDGVIIR